MTALDYLNSKLNSYYSESQVSEILSGMTKKMTTLRRNSLKVSKDELESLLNKENIAFKGVSFYDSAYVIENKDESFLEGLDVYNSGKIYLQSLSSMIPPLVVNPKENDTILDMAAAPGGKTCEMAVLANNKALITAIEKNKIRADRLAYNVKKQDAKIVNIMNLDSRKLDDFFKFDKILLDAPCSGSGTLDISDPNLDKYFSEELVMRSKKTQIDLLKKACKLVNIGGEITYSTCSIFEDENEDVIRTALSNKCFEVVKINLDLYSDVPLLKSKIDGAMLVQPTKYYEGFFVCKIRRVK